MKKQKILIILSFLGLLDAIYLSLPYFTNTQASCSINSVNTCEAVTTSVYAKTFFNIPNAFLGVVFFLSLFLIFNFWEKIEKKCSKISIFLKTILTFAIIFYSYLIYIQKYILGEYCLYCLVSAFITFLIWIIFIRKKNTK